MTTEELTRTLERLLTYGTCVRDGYLPDDNKDISKPLAALIEAAAEPQRHGYEHRCKICAGEFLGINYPIEHKPACAIVALVRAINVETK